MENKEPTTIDEYIASFPPEAQQKMHELRALIRKEAPEAGEKISWRMPTFTLNGNLIHFAAFKKHIGFYPGASGIEAFTSEFTGFHYSKGAVQLPMDKPLPIDLITRIVQYRVAENKSLPVKKGKK